MILATAHGDRESFAAFDTSTPIPRPSQWGGVASHAGKRVDFAGAAGLPAFLRGVRLVCETAAQMPPMVFRGEGREARPEPQAPQLELLRRPNSDQARFQLYAWWFASMIRGNAYILKVKVRREVRALYALHPACVTPKYDAAEPTFEIRQSPMGPIKATYGRDRVIHIPGILVDHPFIGCSVVEAHRNGIGTQLAREEFEGRYLANDGTPGVVLKHPGNQSEEQRLAIRESYQARHSGSANAGRPAVMWGGWELETIAATLDDAQFIEQKRFGLREIALMLGVPPGLLGDPEAPGADDPEKENMRFLTYGLSPWMSRFEQGLAADPDLFPDPELTVELDPRQLLRSAMQTRFTAWREARQGGWITANEIRAEEGREPVEGGDELQQTPVGGAPNKQEAAQPTAQTFNIDARSEPAKVEITNEAPQAPKVEMNPEIVVPAPVVNNTVQAARAPEVHVPAPVVNVEAPNVEVSPKVELSTGSRTISVKRDRKGNVTQYRQES